MPDDRIQYSEAIRDAEASSLNSSDVFAIAQEDAGSATGYVSRATKLLAIASKILKGIDFSTDLDTTNGYIIGAINELKAADGVEIIDTLTAGSTSLVLSDAAILTTSTIDIYTDVFGIQPTNAVVATGSITLTFLAQASDITVKVRVS